MLDYDMTLNDLGLMKSNIDEEKIKLGRLQIQEESSEEEQEPEEEKNSQDGNSMAGSGLESMMGSRLNSAASQNRKPEVVEEKIELKYSKDAEYE